MVSNTSLGWVSSKLHHQCEYLSDTFLSSLWEKPAKLILQPTHSQYSSNRYFDTKGRDVTYPQGQNSSLPTRNGEYANFHRKNVEFSIADKVLFCLHPYRQHSVGKPLTVKLECQFYEPFTITEYIRAVTYQLQLLIDSKIHYVFHVSL